MKKFTILMFVFSLVIFINSGWCQDNSGNPQTKYAIQYETILSSDQTVTTAFKDVGDPIDLRGYGWYKIWIKMDWNDGQDLQIQFLEQLTATGGATDEWVPSVIAVDTDKQYSEPEVIEFNVDGDGVRYRTILIPTNYTVRYLQMQIKMGTDGGVDPVLNKVYITKG